MAPPDIKPGPVTRVCHVCGRQYGLSSFDIHLKQCKKLFIAQEELKPKAERRPVPKTPPGLDGQSGRGGGSADGDGGSERPTREMVEAMNRAAQETYNEHGMEKCENCGRTFAEGRLAIHSKSCRPGNAAKRVDEGASARNKKTEPTIETSSLPSVKKNATRPSAAEREDRDDGTTTRPATSSGPPRPLAGSLASNRKRISSQDPTQSGSALHSPLGTAEIDKDALKRELQGKFSMVEAIQAKLDHWEATTLATLQEIRDLKQLFAQLSSA